MKKTQGVVLLAAVCVTAQLLTGCGGDHAKQTGETQITEAHTDEAQDQIASKEELAASETLDAQGLTPVTADMIQDGTYSIEVESSSSMFRIEECELIVQDGKMTAVMTMGGKGYLKVFMGTGEEAVKASEDAYIPYEENKLGLHTYTVPVEALNQVVDCAAYSKNREKWYDRTLIFHASSIPVDALAEGVVTTVTSLKLEEGMYTVDASLNGGTGKASIESPTTLTVENGQAFVEITWSSSNYDYMKYNGEKYELADTEGNSNFLLPIGVFDWNVPVIADTIAMSEPHEISYSIILDSASIQKINEVIE